jgi:nitrous oxidase accessory protein
VEKRTVKSTLFLLLLFISLALISLPQIEVVKADPKTIVVPDDYQTISDAISNSLEGDTVFVKKGNYDGPIGETLIIDKAISLIGEGSSLIGEETTTLNLHPLLLNTTIFGQPYPKYNTSLIVKSNNVTISGFTIKTPPPPSGGGGGVSVIGNGTRINNCLINIPSLSLGGSYSTISETLLFIGNLIVRGSNQTISQTRIFKGDIEITGSHNNVIGNTMIDQIHLTGAYNIISGNSFSRIFLEYSDSNTIHNNTCSLIWLGIYGHTCSNNVVSGNTLDGGYIWGILMGDGSYNVFYDNYITNYGGSHDGYGVAIGGNHQVAENNTFYHNTFVNNNKNVGYNWQINGIGNSWDNGKEGNYWDDYNGTDANGDGIGDIPYIIDEINQDNYPLMTPINIFDAGIWEWTPYNVFVFSNSTVSDFSFNHESALIRFDVEGENGTTGFCRVTIPKDLLYAEGNWIVLVDENPLTPTVNEDPSNTYIYFTYNHSTKTVEIIGTTAIPEFPSWTPLLIMLVAIVAAAAIYRHNLHKQNQGRRRQ